MEFVYFAHGVVEDAGDNAAVAVAGRSSVAGAEPETADEGLALFVENEFQAHAFAVVLAADEAVVLLHFQVAGVVALGLPWHGGILTCAGSCQLRTKSFNRGERWERPRRARRITGRIQVVGHCEEL
jgi:hypothetical protein